MFNARHSIVAALVFLAFAAAPGGAGAADSCAGDACGALVASATGCAWTNKGEKSIRLSVFSEAAGASLAILAPGETYKEANTARCAADAAPRLDATFMSLKPIPETTAKATPLPKAKPAIVQVSAAQPASAPAAAPAAVATPAVAPVKVAAVGTTPLPRAKPAAPPVYPPLPRWKPPAPVATAAVEPAATPALAPAPAAVVAPSAPVATAEAPISPDAAACKGACPPILFKVFDNCLWVVNLNPRPVAFEADAGGRKIALALEAADGDKADARVAQLKGAAPKDEAGLHMRFRDPFQSAGGGIPLYRARLGSASACVKSRSEIAHFTAAYTN